MYFSDDDFAIDVSMISTNQGRASSAAAQRVRELTDFKRKAKGQAVDRSHLLQTAAARSHSNTVMNNGGKSVTIQTPTSGANTTTTSSTSKPVAGGSSSFVLADMYKLDEPSVYVQLKGSYEGHRMNPSSAAAGGNGNGSSGALLKNKKGSVRGMGLSASLNRLNNSTFSSNSNDAGAEDDDNERRKMQSAATASGNEALIKIGDNYYNLDAPPSAHGGKGVIGGGGPSRPMPALGGRPGQTINGRLASIPLQPLDRTVVTLHPKVRADNPDYYRMVAPVAGMRNEEPVMLSNGGWRGNRGKEGVSGSHALDGDDSDGAEDDARALLSSLAQQQPQTAASSSSAGNPSGTGNAINFIRIVRDVAARQEALVKEQSSAILGTQYSQYSAEASKATASIVGKDGKATTVVLASAIPSGDPSVIHPLDARYSAELMRARATDELFPATDVCRDWREGPIGKHILNWEPKEYHECCESAFFDRAPDRSRKVGGMGKRDEEIKSQTKAHEKALRRQKRRLGGGDDMTSSEEDDDDAKAIVADPQLRSFLSPLDESRLIAEASEMPHGAIVGGGAAATVGGGTNTSQFLAVLSPFNNNNGITSKISSNTATPVVGTLQAPFGAPAMTPLGGAGGRRGSSSSQPSPANTNNAMNNSGGGGGGVIMGPLVAPPTTTTGFHAVTLQMRQETDEPPPSPEGSFLEVLTEAVGLEEALRNQFMVTVMAEHERIAEDKRIATIRQLVASRGGVGASTAAHNIMTQDMAMDLEVTRTFMALSTTAAEDERARQVREREERERVLRKIQDEAVVSHNRKSLLVIPQKINIFRPTSSKSDAMAVSGRLSLGGLNSGGGVAGESAALHHHGGRDVVITPRMHRPRGASTSISNANNRRESDTDGPSSPPMMLSSSLLLGSTHSPIEATAGNANKEEVEGTITKNDEKSSPSMIAADNSSSPPPTITRENTLTLQKRSVSFHMGSNDTNTAKPPSQQGGDIGSAAVTPQSALKKVPTLTRTATATSPPLGPEKKAASLPIPSTKLGGALAVKASGGAVFMALGGTTAAGGEEDMLDDSIEGEEFPEEAAVGSDGHTRDQSSPPPPARRSLFGGAAAVDAADEQNAQKEDVFGNSTSTASNSKDRLKGNTILNRIASLKVQQQGIADGADTLVDKLLSSTGGGAQQPIAVVAPAVVAPASPLLQQSTTRGGGASHHSAKPAFATALVAAAAIAATNNNTTTSPSMSPKLPGNYSPSAVMTATTNTAAHPAVVGMSDSQVAALVGAAAPAPQPVSAERKEAFKAKALSRREVETLWGGAMTACGVLRFAPVDSEALMQRPRRLRRRNTCGEEEWSSDTDEDEWWLNEPLSEASLRRRSSSVLASVVASASPDARRSAGNATSTSSNLSFTPSAAFPFAKPAAKAANRPSSAAMDAAILHVVTNGASNTLGAAASSGDNTNTISPTSPSKHSPSSSHAGASGAPKSPHATAAAQGHSNARTALEAVLPKAFAGKSGTWLRRIYFPLIYHQMLSRGDDAFNFGEDAEGDAERDAFASDLQQNAAMSNALRNVFSDEFDALDAIVPKSRDPHTFYAASAAGVLLFSARKLPSYIKHLNEEGLRLHLHQVKLFNNYDPLLAAAARNAGKIVYVPVPRNYGDTSESSDSEDDKKHNKGSPVGGRTGLSGAYGDLSPSSPAASNSTMASKKANDGAYRPPTSKKQRLRDLAKARRGVDSVYNDPDRFGIQRAKAMGGKTSGKHSDRAVAQRARRDRKRGFKTSIETVFDFNDSFEVADELLREVGLSLAAKPIHSSSMVDGEKGGMGGQHSFSFRTVGSFTFGADDDCDAINKEGPSRYRYGPSLSKEDEAQIIAIAKSQVSRQKKMEMDSLLHIIYHHNQLQLQRNGGIAARKDIAGEDANAMLLGSGGGSGKSVAVVPTDLSIMDVPQSRFRASIWKDMNRKRRQKNVSDRRERAGKEVFTERDEEGDLVDYNQNRKEKHRQRLAELCADAAGANASSSGRVGSCDPANLTLKERDVVFSRLPLDEDSVPTYFAQPRKGTDTSEMLAGAGGGAGMASGAATSGGGGVGGGGGGAIGMGNASLAHREIEALAQRFIKDEISDEVWHGYSEGQNNKVLAKRAAMAKLDEWVHLQMRLNRRLVVPNQLREAERHDQYQREMAQRIQRGLNGGGNANATNAADNSTAAAANNNNNTNNKATTSNSRRSSVAATSVYATQQKTSPRSGGGPKHADGTESTHSQVLSNHNNNNNIAKRGAGGKDAETSSSAPTHPNTTNQHQNRSSSPYRGDGRPYVDDGSHSVPYIVDSTGNTTITAKEDKKYQSELIKNNFSPDRRAGQHYRDRATLSDRQYVAKMLQADKERIAAQALEDERDMARRKSILAMVNGGGGGGAEEDGTNNIPAMLQDEFVKKRTTVVKPLTPAQRLAASMPSEKPKVRTLDKAGMAAMLTETTPPASILYKVSDEYRQELNDLKHLRTNALKYEKSQDGYSTSKSIAYAAAAAMADGNGNHLASSSAHALPPRVGDGSHNIKRSVCPPRPSSVTEMRAALARNPHANGVVQQLMGGGDHNSSGGGLGVGSRALRASTRASSSAAASGAAARGGSVRPASAGAVALNHRRRAGSISGGGGAGGGGAFSGQSLRPANTSVMIAGTMFSYDGSFVPRGMASGDGD